MRNATPVLPFKMRRSTRRHYFLRVNFRPFSFFMRTTCAKINPGYLTFFNLPRPAATATAATAATATATA